MIEAKDNATGRALLFDIDGTLANTDPLHLKAFNEVLGPRGHVFDHARFSRELQGFANVSIGERFLPDEAPERRALILDEKEEVFRALVAGQIEPLPGLMALARPGGRGRRSHGCRDQRAASQRRAAALRPRHSRTVSRRS
jgi:FMN phosphatase YigB (HAD superfamily)